MNEMNGQPAFRRLLVKVAMSKRQTEYVNSANSGWISKNRYSFTEA
jgi:hypothetical protein